jgi:hypothetical protein
MAQGISIGHSQCNNTMPVLVCPYLSLFCVAVLWLYHFAFPLYRLHDLRVIRKAIWFPPVERLQWLQVPVEH